MTQNKKFVAKRLRDSESNIVTKMWNIQSRLDDVIARGRGDTDLDTPRHIIDAGINALNNGATHYTHPMGSTIVKGINSSIYYMSWGI
jgi:aspartate/methionine/tyrosine aminotransferase